jgi:hypothetical protein
MFRLFVTLLCISFTGNAAFASQAPVNLAPNSQWEVWSGVSWNTQYNYQATGTTAPLAASGNTTGSQGRSTFTVSSTGDLSVGDLVQASGAGLDPCLATGPMRIVALVPNASLTVRTYRGCAPSSSVASTLIMVGVGNQASVGTGDGPDGWTKSVTLPIWRNENRGNYSSNVPNNVGAIASLGARKPTSGAAYIYTAYSGASLAQFAGKTIVFGIYGYQKVRGGSSTWRVFVNDSVNGQRTPCAAAPTTAQFNWLECSVTVPANTTYFQAGVSLDGLANDSYFFSNPVLAIGDTIGGPQFYQKPRNEILLPRVHTSPAGWINASVTFPSTTATYCGGYPYCFERDFYAETGGAVAMTVRKIHGQLEGFNCGVVATSTGVVRVMAFYNSGFAPSISGSFLPQYVRCVKSFSYMDYPLNQKSDAADITGTGIFTTGIAGDAWQNVSEELDWFILN